MFSDKDSEWSSLLFCVSENGSRAFTKHAQHDERSRSQSRTSACGVRNCCSITQLFHILPTWRPQRARSVQTARCSVRTQITEAIDVSSVKGAEATTSKAKQGTITFVCCPVESRIVHSGICPEFVAECCQSDFIHRKCLQRQILRTPCRSWTDALWQKWLLTWEIDVATYSSAAGELSPKLGLLVIMMSGTLVVSKKHERQTKMASDNHGCQQNHREKHASHKSVVKCTRTSTNGR